MPSFHEGQHAKRKEGAFLLLSLLLFLFLSVSLSFPMFFSQGNTSRRYLTQWKVPKIVRHVPGILSWYGVSNGRKRGRYATAQNQRNKTHCGRKLGKEGRKSAGRRKGSRCHWTSVTTCPATPSGWLNWDVMIR
ncbi:uncharacterized protein BDZ83DRAFT_621656 [Colletotrichum acutatum]|uniref:Uncharacterized protein n=1 Tax=Glomerella acutata TaxID=27357 RepID=A0AAD8UMY1_GLOAC|nr:uncharacterized protein BDZ83DRAFT_621656 [Colletotrichum acutatum]KAK1724910.1 hypothetical protein BDZ83DRAFT_621656 [Colletotrichum acutatum]